MAECKMRRGINIMREMKNGFASHCRGVKEYNRERKYREHKSKENRDHGSRKQGHDVLYYIKS